MSETLLGLAIDVSASMKESINNSSTESTRFDLILDAINKHVRKIDEGIRSQENYTDDAKFFAFLFGLNDGGSGEVCDFLGLIDEFNHLEGGVKAKLASGRIDHMTAWAILKRIMPKTLTLSELVTFWQNNFGQSKGALQKVIFGNTPMCSVLRAMENRFDQETRDKRYNPTRKVLCLVSDGLPNDGDPLPIVMRLQSQYQIQVVACYITNRNVAASKTIFENAKVQWDDGAKLMFNLASSVNIDPMYPQHLRNEGWSIPPQGKLFFQLNHSDILEWFSVW